MTSGPRYHDDSIGVPAAMGTNGGQSATLSEDVEQRLSALETNLVGNTTRLTTLETAGSSNTDQSVAQELATAIDYIHDVENVTSQNASRHNALSTNHQHTRDTLTQLLEKVHGSTVVWPDGANQYTTSGSLLTSYRATADFQMNEWPNLQSSLEDVYTALLALTVRVEALEAHHAGSPTVH